MYVTSSCNPKLFFSTLLGFRCSSASQDRHLHLFLFSPISNRVFLRSLKLYVEEFNIMIWNVNHFYLNISSQNWVDPNEKTLALSVGSAYGRKIWIPLWATFLLVAFFEARGKSELMTGPFDFWRTCRILKKRISCRHTWTPNMFMHPATAKTKFTHIQSKKILFYAYTK